MKGSLSAWCPSFQKDSTSTAQVSCRKRHVCVGRCRSATPCTRVRTGNFFVNLIRKRHAHQKSRIATSQFENFENSASSKVKLFAGKSRTGCASTRCPVLHRMGRHGCKARASRFAASRCAATKDAQRGLLQLTSAPNEATTSIWLKAMMVWSDLSRNTEFLENESGTEVASWEPEGQVGVDSARQAIY